MPNDSAMRNRITRLARSGALARAWSLLEQSGLAAAENDPRALALRARLKKDRAKQTSGKDRIGWLEQSSADYLRAAEIDGTSYPLINAASLALLSGRKQQAAQLAQRTLDLIDANPDEAETRYWRGATRAEALLLIGRTTEARAALRGAVADAPDAFEDRAATVGQFEMICAELGQDARWLDQFRPPRSVYFSGIMGIAQNDTAVQGRIADWLDAENIKFGYGALAAGADIWIAEALLARKAELHVILPCSAEDFREQSVLAVSPEWGERFDRLMEQAETVHELDAATSPSPAAVQLGKKVAQGMAVHNARLLQSEALGLEIGAIGEALDPLKTGPGRNMHMEVARKAGTPFYGVSETGRARAMLRIIGEAANREFASPAEAWEAASAARAQGKAVALDYQFVPHDADAGNPGTDRLSALVDVTEPGQSVATMAMSFALLAEKSDLHVGALGDVRTASGYVPLYSLA